MEAKLIAPCGINCGLCINYLRKGSSCPGCYAGRKLSGKEIQCGRRNCHKRQGSFCFDCDDFPCVSLKRLDLRYRKNYGISVIQNLLDIQGMGIESFIQSEKLRWINEDGITCMHDHKKYKEKTD